MQHTVQYNTEALHATQSSKMQPNTQYTVQHNTAAQQTTHSAIQYGSLLYNTHCIIQYCSPTCNVHCNTVLQPNLQHKEKDSTAAQYATCSTLICCLCKADKKIPQHFKHIWMSPYYFIQVQVFTKYIVNSAGKKNAILTLKSPKLKK